MTSDTARCGTWTKVPIGTDEQPCQQSAPLFLVHYFNEGAQIHPMHLHPWVWHCHILSHAERETGMFGMISAVVVE